MTVWEVVGLGLELVFKDTWLDSELECWVLGVDQQHLATAVVEPETERVLILELVAEPRYYWTELDIALDSPEMGDWPILEELNRRLWKISNPISET